MTQSGHPQLDASRRAVRKNEHEMTRHSNQNRNVIPGGPATINGVLYQLLWGLLQASRARFIGQPAVSAGCIQEVVILLEPAGGGGDLVLDDAKRRSVEQLKARPDGGAWSLREIVEDVIPNLYLAAYDTFCKPWLGRLCGTPG